MSLQARFAGPAADGVRQGLFAPDRATEAFGDLLRTLVDAERFPALRRAVEGGAFAPVQGDVYAPFDLGLELILDGIEALMSRQPIDPATSRPRPGLSGEA